MKCIESVAAGILISLTTTISHGATLCSDHDRQVDSLIAQMTLDEKIGQMVQVDSSALQNRADVQKYFLDSVLSGGNSDPVTGNMAQDWLNFVAEFQAPSLQTRLKIPLIYGIDAVHGHNNIDGAVIFPHNIGLGATHDPTLVERAERVIAKEVAGIECQGMTDVLFGDYKFTGKLPCAWPRSNGYIRAGNTTDIPLFPSGYGLNR